LFSVWYFQKRLAANFLPAAFYLLPVANVKIFYGGFYYGSDKVTKFSAVDLYGDSDRDFVFFNQAIAGEHKAIFQGLMSRCAEEF